ncbi:hypothetical protein [Leptolyngbya sp. FACHB-16]|uniref:hypothetical protein n=1 Tax=unclassified Leptolyngbya TaxID=2650499 RepID=UPI0016875361|nr:hypothetical protein [Leptolyngbya sp. FACHB-16]MBD2156301.1 hypothetical protein [Leptolyngbya sp. FACHB-16]
MLIFLTKAAPGYELGDWLTQSFRELADDDGEASINAGNNIVKLSFDRVTTLMFLSVEPQ